MSESGLQSCDWFKAVDRVVIKIGSRALVDEDNCIDEPHVARLVEQVAELRSRGWDVVCVSSGAVAAGLGELGLQARPQDLPSLQACAALGQTRLMGLYRQEFARHGLSAAQVLLTHADLRARERHLNARNTFRRLLKCGAVPIVNENDTVAVDEIRFGDNDMLSALVAMLLHADVLILLTTVDGLLDRPPEQGGQLMQRVTHITDQHHAVAGGSGSDVSIGGMQTKVRAAEMVTRAGEHCIVANGRTPGILTRLADGESLGTVFEPAPSKMAGRKRWIAFFDHPRGELHVDPGAARALQEQGRSLLAIGIRTVKGAFDRGAPVRVLDPSGREIARGLVNYDSQDLTRIAGLRTDEIAATLGQREYEEVVHRDNLVLSGGSAR